MRKIEQQLDRTETCLSVLGGPDPDRSEARIHRLIMDILDFIGMATERIHKADASSTPLKFRRLVQTIFDVQDQADTIYLALSLKPECLGLRIELQKSMEMFNHFLGKRAHLLVVSWGTDMSVDN